MKEFSRSDVTVLLEIISQNAKKLCYYRENGDISESVFQDLIDSIHLRCNDKDVNEALDDIIKDIVGTID